MKNITIFRSRRPYKDTAKEILPAISFWQTSTFISLTFSWWHFWIRFVYGKIGETCSCDNCNCNLEE